MYHNGNAVDYKHNHEGMTDFLTYLSNFTDKPVLVGHNIKRFDCHVLFNTLKSMNMYSELCERTIAFLDSLNLFKLVSPGLSSYSQSFVVDKLLGQQYEAHNAVYDTKLLLNLVTEKGNVSQYITELAFSPSYPQLYQMQLANLKTFEKLVQSKCLSKAMALKTARSRISRTTK